MLHPTKSGGLVTLPELDAPSTRTQVSENGYVIKGLCLDYMDIDTGALMRCSVKDTMDTLLKAAIHAEVDPLRCVSENIILDQLPRKGKSFDLLFDREKININA
ncbi:hypothetical protein DAPPUDRAFT_323448 [Daphnia pulex]|uniref:Uncharacterized protein n=1 Tax=Daphnia pulex TaxID=6669 RepID=E9GYW0_DAPPU|nr:hypothetical protein DAPPUDRAFT_323448 [Daphnia pulex]|eukprot:EFX75225.1 hypothetical protein DAPPUDRAFT_323448 [Daphnia pulex]